MNLPDFLTQDEYGAIRLTDHRIELAHLIHYYNEGYSPEMLLCEFPTLSLPLIHKTIAFYLENQAEADAYAAHWQAEIDRQRAAAKQGPGMAELRQRLEVMRRAEKV